MVASFKTALLNLRLSSCLSFEFIDESPCSRFLDLFETFFSCRFFLTLLLRSSDSLLLLHSLSLFSSLHWLTSLIWNSELAHLQPASHPAAPCMRSIRRGGRHRGRQGEPLQQGYNRDARYTIHRSELCDSKLAESDHWSDY